MIFGKYFCCLITLLIVSLQHRLLMPVIGSFIEHSLSLSLLSGNLEHLRSQILPPPPHNVPQPLHLLRCQIPLLQCRLPRRRSLGTLAGDERPLLLPRALPPDLLFRLAAAIPAVHGDVPANVPHRLLRLGARDEEVPDRNHIPAANPAD
ncbi:hypothetical protein V8G54_020817 [Vigna mungo]|uniref:Uncharacterized protein n=1 Tax=Vigna mungo TaxID=3915 RepID=A0AAQ3RX44_VIGMU